MKRLLLFLLSITIITLLYGKEVPVEKAQVVATTFFINQNSSTLKSATQINLTLVGEITPQIRVQDSRYKSTKGKNTPEYYIFNINYNEGFVIVSGDDVLTRFKTDTTHR